MNESFLNRLRQAVFIAVSSFYLFLWAGGIFSYVMDGGPPAALSWTAPIFLLMASLIVVSTSAVSEILFLLLGGIIGFISEVAGVHYGLVFGGYRYTDVLSPNFLEVPLVMICAWLVLVGYVRQMLAGFKLSRWLLIIIASIWMTAIDLVIDPLAAGALGYWRWFEKGVYYGIPTHNFIGWFAVSFLVFWSLRGQVVKNVWAQHTGLSIILFFTLLAFMHGLIIAGLAGIVLIVIHIMVIRTHFSGVLFPKPFP
jgi:putative membrane protein